MTQGESDTPAEKRRPGPGRPPSLQDPQRVILGAAAQLFADRGYDRASLQDIAGAVGITKAGLYHYFTTKQEIYDSVTLDVLDTMLTQASASVAAEATSAGKLRAFMIAHATYFDDNHDKYRAIFLGRLAEGEDYTAEQLAARRRYTDLIAAILREGQRTGEFATNDAALLARGILGMLNWMARWYRPSGRDAASQIAASYAQVLLAGLTRT
jgi:AcrR family transcriptional regulator